MQKKRNDDNTRFLVSKPSRQRLEELAKDDAFIRAGIAAGVNFICVDEFEAE